MNTERSHKTNSSITQNLRILRQSLLYILLLLWFFGGTSASAQSLDNVYYSASNCTPVDGGFRWDISKGGLYNHDQDNRRRLICPIPYYRNSNDLSRIRVRIVIEDRHNFGNNGTVHAVICRQTATGNADCVASSGVQTTIPFVGVEILDTGITPNNATRWIYANISVPDVDSNNGISGVKGYRVLRQ